MDEPSYIRNVTGTLRSQERPKVKSSLLSLSIVAEMNEEIEEIESAARESVR
jgi:hypothetical protein